jgi:antitoxin ParD1/3/4
MAKNTSILLGDHFEKFIHSQIKGGKFTSASEVVRTALRLFEYEETKKTALIDALIEGERSGVAKPSNSKSFLSRMHKKYKENQ